MMHSDCQHNAGKCTTSSFPHSPSTVGPSSRVSYPCLIPQSRQRLAAPSNVRLDPFNTVFLFFLKFLTTTERC